MIDLDAIDAEPEHQINQPSDVLTEPVMVENVNEYQYNHQVLESVLELSKTTSPEAIPPPPSSSSSSSSTFTPPPPPSRGGLKLRRPSLNSITSLSSTPVRSAPASTSSGNVILYPPVCFHSIRIK